MELVRDRLAALYEKLFEERRKKFIYAQGKLSSKMSFGKDWDNKTS